MLVKIVTYGGIKKKKGAEVIKLSTRSHFREEEEEGGGGMFKSWLAL